MKPCGAWDTLFGRSLSEQGWCDRAVTEARGQERMMSMISKGTGPVERNHWRSDNGCVGEQQGRGKNPSDTEVRKRIDEL